MQDMQSMLRSPKSCASAWSHFSSTLFPKMERVAMATRQIEKLQRKIRQLRSCSTYSTCLHFMGLRWIFCTWPVFKVCGDWLEEYRNVKSYSSCQIWFKGLAGGNLQILRNYSLCPEYIEGPLLFYVGSFVIVKYNI